MSFISSSVLSNHVGRDWILLLFLAFWHISSSSCSSVEWLHMSLQAAFPMKEGFLSCEKPSLAVCSSTQMSYKKFGSSPAMFTLCWIWVNSFRCLCIVFSVMPDSVPTGEGRLKLCLVVFTALPKGKGQVACKVNLSSRTLCPQHLQHQGFILFKVQAESKVYSCQSHSLPSP